MTGIIVNAAAILLGALAGLLFRKGLPEASHTIMQVLGLAANNYAKEIYGIVSLENSVYVSASVKTANQKKGDVCAF